MYRRTYVCVGGERFTPTRVGKALAMITHSGFSSVMRFTPTRVGTAGQCRHRLT